MSAPARCAVCGGKARFVVTPEKYWAAKCHGYMRLFATYDQDRAQQIWNAEQALLAGYHDEAHKTVQHKTRGYR